MTKLQGFTSVIKSAIRLSAITLGLSALGIGQSWAGDAVAGQTSYTKAYTSAIQGIVVGGCSSCHGTPSPTSNTLKIANGISTAAIKAACQVGKMPCPENNQTFGTSALTDDDFNNLATYIANAIGAPLSTATCIGGPCAVTVPVAVTFGSASPTSPVKKSVAVTNSSSNPLTVINTMLSQNTDFRVAMGTCNGPIQPGGSCALDVTFSPANPANFATSVGDVLNIYTDFDPSAGSVNHVQLVGDSMGANASLTWTSIHNFFLDNAALEMDEIMPATLTNSGPEAVTMSNWVLSGDVDPNTNKYFRIGASPNAVQPCTNLTALAAGASCNVDLIFRASGSGGTYSATLKFSTNGQLKGGDLKMTAKAVWLPKRAGGCTIGRPDQPLDPLWLMMLGGAGFALYRRRRQQMH